MKKRKGLLKFVEKFAGKIDPIKISITPLPLRYKGRPTTLIYVKFNDHKVKKTERVGDRVFIDFDNRNKLVGVEII